MYFWNREDISLKQRGHTFLPRNSMMSFSLSQKIHAGWNFRSTMDGPSM